MDKKNKTKHQLIKEIDKLRKELAKGEAITAEKLHTNDKLQESEKKYRSLFENATDAIYLIDIETQKILDCNPITSRVTGYSFKELKSMSVEDLFPVDEQDVVSKIFRKIATKGSLSGISSINQLRKDGILVPVEINATTLEINKKKCCLAIIRDIAERRQAVIELKKSEEKYRALFKHMFIGCAFHKIIADKNNRPTDYIYLEINDAFERLTGFKRAEVIGKKITELVPDIKKEKPDLISIYGDVALKGEVAKFELPFKPLNKWYSVSAYSPMKGYFVALFDDISHRKYWEEKLRESEEKYRRLFESAYDSIFIIDPDTRRFLDMNENAAKRLGYSRKELLGLTIDDIEAPMAADRNDDIIRELSKKGSVIFEHVHRRKNGSEIPVEISSRIIEYGDKRAVESFARDITARRKAVETLHESEKRFRDISENAMVWIWEVDGAGRYTYSGPIVESILGYKPEEILGKYFYDFFHPDDREKLKKGALDVFASKQPFRKFINRNIHKNGNIVWLSTSGTPITDKTGNLLGYRGADSDITFNKLAEEKLVRAEWEWEATFNSIPDLILITDRRHRIVKVNRAMADKLGMKRENIQGRLCYEVIHGSDQPPTNCPHTATLTDGKEYTQEVYEDALKGYFIFSSSPIYDSHNNLLGIVEIARDITQRKTMEQKLQETAITDELTGLFNRRGFFTFSNQQLKLAKRKRQILSLLYLDLDNMKDINDDLGHTEGDKALIDTANVLRKTFRESDIVARVGGDEFAVLLLDPANPDVKKVIVRNFQKKLLEFNELYDRQYNLHISVGVATYNPESPCSVDELIAQADKLMYEEKKQKLEGEVANASGDDFIEKRAFKRYKTGDDCWATVGNSKRLKIIDVSLGGIYLKALKNLSLKTIHDIRIMSPDRKGIQSIAKVVRSCPVESKSGEDSRTASCETAFEFDKKNTRLKNFLKEFIKSLNK